MMTWSNITKKNATKTLQHSPKNIKQVQKQQVKNDYWSQDYDCGWQTIEQQIKNSYIKLGLEPPKSIYGRPSPSSFTK